MTGATDGCQLTPSIFPAPSPHPLAQLSLGPLWLTEGGALTPTSPELGTAAAGKPVQQGGGLGGGGKGFLQTTSLSLSPQILHAISSSPLPLSDFSNVTFRAFPSCSLTTLLTIAAHPPPEFLSTEIWTAPPSARPPLGPPERRRKNLKIKTVHLSNHLKLLQAEAPVSSTNLDPYREALAERFPLRLAVCRDVRDSRGGGGGSDGDGAVGDVLAGGAVHLSVGCLYGCCEGLHAVDALRGVGQAGLGADASPRAGAPVHVGILG